MTVLVLLQQFEQLNDSTGTIATIRTVTAAALQRSQKRLSLMIESLITFSVVVQLS